MWYNWPGVHDQDARNFHYIILLAFCQAKSRIKLYKYFIPNLCIIPSCNLVRSVVYYHCQEGYTPPEINRHQDANGKQIAGGWKDFQKIFQIYWKKYLTRFGWCAIMMVHGKGTPRTKVKEKFSKTLKNLLTNRPSCDTIRATQPRWLVKLATKPCRVHKEVKVQ